MVLPHPRTTPFPHSFRRELCPLLAPLSDYLVASKCTLLTVIAAHLDVSQVRRTASPGMRLIAANLNKLIPTRETAMPAAGRSITKPGSEFKAAEIRVTFKELGSEGQVAALEQRL